jgi:hypothetical protein
MKIMYLKVPQIHHHHQTRFMMSPQVLSLVNQAGCVPNVQECPRKVSN